MTSAFTSNRQIHQALFDKSFATLMTKLLMQMQIVDGDGSDTCINVSANQGSSDGEN